MIAALADHYSWPPDYWKKRPDGTGMGWREFRNWLRITNQTKERQRRGHTTSPDSWEGRDNDPFWNRGRR